MTALHETLRPRRRPTVPRPCAGRRGRGAAASGGGGRLIAHVPATSPGPAARRPGRAAPGGHRPRGVLAAQRVRVDGSIVTNPRARVRSDAGITIRPEDVPRPRQAGRPCGCWAWTPRPRVPRRRRQHGRVHAGAARGRRAAVYAVDAGHGQLLGRLRADPRVVNLERTNVADLNTPWCPSRVSTVVVDVSS